MTAYFDGCYFDPLYFDASACAPGQHLGRHVRGRKRRPFIPLLPEPVVEDVTEAIDTEREAAQALVAAVVADATMRVLVRQAKRRREDEWLLELVEAA